MDQYLWSTAVVAALARALREAPELRLIAVIPRFPDQGGRLSLPPNLVGRIDALETLQRADGDRVAVYSPRTPKAHPSTSMPRCASSTTRGPHRVGQPQPALVDP